MYWRRSSTIKYLVAASIGAILYCEWAIYLIQPAFWPKLECQTEESCTKILFIADPQIQGDTAVPPPLSYLFNWDSDRYLKSTFSVVLRHFKPEVLAYLGDLMDEGSIATMPQFHNYVKRLFNIFEVDYPIVQVWVPGDNDIGGENEPVRVEKVLEFDRVFQQPTLVKYKDVSFYKVNGITRRFQQGVQDDHNFKIVVSHYPITIKHEFANQVNKEIRPDIYFCAHDHHSKYVKQNKDLSKREIHWYQYGEDILNISTSFLYEVYVPTCSYRMGTSEIGYGVAVVEKNKQGDFSMRYAVYWSPKRFPYLLLYLVLLVFLILYFMVFYMAQLLRRHLFVIRSSDKIPLLDRV